MLEEFTRHELDSSHSFFSGMVPAALRLSAPQFEELWALHPDTFPTIKMFGRCIKTPRFQQAYGTDYQFSGRVYKALAVPGLVQSFLDWSRLAVHQELNGILINWYDGSLGHYIGKHRDSIKHMVPDAPIVTLSFGAERVFRLRPWKQAGYRDFAARNGAVFVMPYATNLAWTHEVPASAKLQGRRISVSIRAFQA